MLTDNEKAIVRILISRNAKPEYMQQLAGSDDFARSEIAAKKAGIIEQKTRELSLANTRKDMVVAEVAAVEADLAILQS